MSKKTFLIGSLSLLAASGMVSVWANSSYSVTIVNKSSNYTLNYDNTGSGANYPATFNSTKQNLAPGQNASTYYFSLAAEEDNVPLTGNVTLLPVDAVSGKSATNSWCNIGVYNSQPYLNNCYPCTCKLKSQNANGYTVEVIYQPTTSTQKRA